MYNIFLQSHSIIRYLILIFLGAAILISLYKLASKGSFSKFDDRVSLYLVIFTHLQFAAGVVLYFLSPFVSFTGNMMHNNQLRYWTMEHVVMMIVAIVLITVGRSRMKKSASPSGKYKALLLFNSLALVVILVAIITSGRGIL